MAWRAITVDDQVSLTELVQGCIWLRDGEGAELYKGKDISVQAWTGR